jgi:hypothetical protein
VHQEFVLLGGRFGDALAIRIDDHRIGHAVMAIFDARCGPRATFDGRERSLCKAG